MDPVDRGRHGVQVLVLGEAAGGVAGGRSARAKLPFGREESERLPLQPADGPAAQDPRHGWQAVVDVLARHVPPGLPGPDCQYPAPPPHQPADNVAAAADHCHAAAAVAAAVATAAAANAAYPAAVHAPPPSPYAAAVPGAAAACCAASESSVAVNNFAKLSSAPLPNAHPNPCSFSFFLKNLFFHVSFQCIMLSDIRSFLTGYANWEEQRGWLGDSTDGVWLYAQGGLRSRLPGAVPWAWSESVYCAASGAAPCGRELSAGAGAVAGSAVAGVDCVAAGPRVWAARRGGRPGSADTA
ncbi:hypothetical protein DL89DRAFT_28194 [Linderina pennispora]|uniref:Uncharacterized protein n=1 Tax=Linderina pennispora TaxID=61395 RepID=A0A1Y1W4U9_9FUNG|nr:uncharacterized protein DL89DRAFT_28194 [Linderina pennispora]ORX68224.1 hypothetical protein DL89DRAFT_28194 [Linderina pennispora]